MVWHGARAVPQYYIVCQLVCAACGFSLVLFRAETIDSFAGAYGGGLKRCVWDSRTGVWGNHESLEQLAYIPNFNQHTAIYTLYI